MSERINIENDLREVISNNIYIMVDVAAEFLDKKSTITLISAEDMKHINKEKVKELIESVIKEFELTHPAIKLTYSCSEDCILTMLKTSCNLSRSGTLCAIDYNMRRFKRAVNVIDQNTKFVSAFLEI